MGLKEMETDLLTLQEANRKVGECLTHLKDVSHSPVVLSIISLAEAIDRVNTLLLSNLQEMIATERGG